MKVNLENETNIKEHEPLVEGTKLDLDIVLEDEVGAWGKYQLKVILFTLWFVITVALTGDQYLFTTTRIPTRCLISECENSSTTSAHEFSPQWISKAVPVAESGVGFDSCHRYASTNNLTDTQATSDESCPANLFDNNTIVPCEAYVYENQDTVVYDFGLACQEWRRSMIGSARTFGWLISHPLTGFISDRWGRRTALAFNCFNCAWIGLTRYFATSYIPYILSELIESILGGGAFACVYILLMEIVGPKRRVIVGALCSTGTSIGHLFVAGIAWAVPYWRNFLLAIYIPQLLLFPTILLVSESVRWLISKGQYEKAESMLKDIARTNGTQISTNTIMTLKNAVKEEKSQISNKQQEEKDWLVVLVFKHKPILIRCLVTPVMWITLTLIFYGLLINSVNLTAGNKVFNYFAVSLAEVPGYWTACLLLDRIGRKPVLAGGFGLCAFSLIACIFVPIDYKIVSLVLYMVGKFSIACVGTSLYVFTSELYPTQYRHRLVAFCSTMGRFGSLFAPLTPAFGEKIAFLLFGSLAVVSGLLVLVLPETLGRKLPDTLEEAANLRQSRHTTNTPEQIELK
ncbi:sugar transporter domain-containing protein [Phthorimaea operculella]|nr:sugar transporter domain-containing protein [Phthorimaea operculella]